MIAAFERDLPAAGVTRHGLPVIKHFVAGLDQQQVARGRDGGRLNRAQLFDVFASELEGLAGVEVVVGADESSQQGWRRPLAHWLQLEEARLNRAGDAAAAAAMARQRARVLADVPEAAAER